MIGFTTNTIFVVIGTLAFFGIVIFLFMNLYSDRCSGCHGKMVYQEDITIFEGAKSLNGSVSFPAIHIRKYECSSCGSLYLQMYTPNMAKSVVKFYTGEDIKEYIHLSDEQVINKVKQNLKNNMLNPSTENNEFKSCLASANTIYEQANSEHGIAISELAFKNIYQMVNKHVADMNKRV